MFCPNCGKELGPASKFCKYCGMAVKTPIGVEKCEPQQPIRESEKPKEQPTSARAPEKNATANLGTLGTAFTLIVKIIILVVIVWLLRNALSSLTLIDGTLLIWDSTNVFASILVIGFLEIGLAEFSKRFHSNGIDRLFLIFPIVPLIIIAIIVVLNIGRFFDSLGIAEGGFSLLLLAAGTYACDMVYKVRFSKDQLKSQISEMTDKEIEDLKGFATDPQEIDQMREEAKREDK